MPQPLTTKICLVGDSLSEGGAERVHAVLSNYFVSQGIEVHNVVVQDNVSYKFSGDLLNLGLLKDKKNGIGNKLKRFLVLRKYIKKHKFDYVIDFRMRKKYIQDWLIANFIYTVPVVYTVHSAVLEWYMPKQPWFVRAIYSSAYGVVSITHKMKSHIEKLYKLKNVINIYNPVDIDYIKSRYQEQLVDDIGSPFIIAAGSMHAHNVKQFDKLITAYANSVLPKNNIKLLLLGEGILKEALKQLADEKGVLGKVIFKGFHENPYVYMHNAMFYVLSSKYEGLPMVLLESLACETPVIAFDCFTGPSEIILDKKNGLLIENQNIAKLTDGINLMFEDQELLIKCRKNAVESIANFSIDSVGSCWIKYLKIITKT